MSLLRPVDSGAVRDVPFATDARPRRNAGKVPDVRTGMEERFRMTAISGNALGGKWLITIGRMVAC